MLKEDVRNIERLIEIVKNTMEEVVGNMEEVIHNYKHGDRELFEKAWSELNPSDIFDDVLRKIKDTDKVTDFQLEVAGLTGDQLALKLAWIKSAKEEWNSDHQKLSLSLWRLLKMVNAVLGSLAKVFPLVEAIRELKDFIEVRMSN